MLCNNCGKIFGQKYEGQTVCGKCYFKLHPEKDYTRASRERLFGALGMKPPKSGRSFPAFSPQENDKGSSDEEEVTAVPASNPEGISPNRLEIGNKLPDGSVFLGKMKPDNSVCLGKGQTILSNH